MTGNNGPKRYCEGLAQGRWSARFVVVVVYTTGCVADPDFGNCEHAILFIEPFAMRDIHGNHSLDQELDSLSDSSDGPVEPQ